MNDNKPKFKHILLGTAAFIALAVPQVYAADEDVADDENFELEEIVVTGIRGSQMRALQTKRNSDGIMDGIAAEDMGKFPDQNISEALQRIPGVTISRAGGEGQFVTVRGMGPAFNTVLLNGRVLATENDGREFSFDILAAELISAAEVHKTPTASLIEGGIGATINMKTARPLDKEGFHGAISAKGLYDTSREEVSPFVSGYVSQTSNDGEFGVLGSFSYINRKFRNERIFTDGFEANRPLDFDNDGTPEFTGVSLPTFVSNDISESERERISGTIALQWQASDDLLLTLDGLYSKLDVNDDTRFFFHYGGPDQIVEATLDENNTVISSRQDGTNGQAIGSFIRPRLGETYQTGFNAEWQGSDNLSAVFDTAYSKSTDSTSGNQAWFDARLNTDKSNIVFNEVDGLPVFSGFGDISDTSAATFGWFTWEGRSISDETFQATFDLNYDFDDAGALVSIQAGSNYAYREKAKTVAKTPGDVQCLFCGVPLDQSVFSTVDASGFLGGDSFNTDFPTFSITELEEYFLSDAGIDAAAVNRAGPGADAVAIAVAKAEIQATIAANGGDLGVQPVPGEGGTVTEKNYGAYVQAKFEGTIGNAPWSGNLGLRYTRTDVKSSGVGQEILDIFIPTGGGSTDPVAVFSDPIPISESGSYNVWLPSANFKLDMYEDIVFRAAIGKTLTRATLSDLMLARSFNVRERERNVSSGNPGLKPMVAWNYDANLTWYIDDASYMSVAWFHKDLSDKSRRETNIVQILGFDFLSNRPENLGNGSIDGVELSAQYTFSSLPAPFDGLGLQGNYTNVTQKTDGEEDNETSETYNVVGFYEKGPIQARIAYNYRAGYLDSPAANRGQPKHIRAYGQWDASFSYDVTEDITVFLEAINITNSQTLSFSIFENRVIEIADTGSRYTIGARWNF